mgnify:CR=1 FL=1
MDARSAISVRRSEPAHGDGVVALILAQRAQAARAEDLDRARVVLAAHAVDRDPPLRLATAGRVFELVTVIALAPLRFAVEAGDEIEIEVSKLHVLDRRGLLRVHHPPIFPVRLPARNTGGLRGWAGVGGSPRCALSGHGEMEMRLPETLPSWFRRVPFRQGVSAGSSGGGSQVPC